MDKDKPVQGYVVYTEFRQGASTLQMFFTPDGFTTEGRFVGMKRHHRVISEATPKKQWKISSAPDHDVRNNVVDGEPLTYDAEFADERLGFCHSLLNTMLNGGWEMVKHPVVVEASKKDMDDLAAFKTPTKIIYRINQTREAAGFPESLF